MALPLASLLWLSSIVGVLPRNRMTQEAFANSFGAQATLVAIAALAAIGVAGGVSYLRSYLRLSAELLETEERFHRVFDSARNGLVLLSDQGELQVYNPAMLELIGYDAASIATDRARLGRRIVIADLVSPEDLDRLLSMGQARLAGESLDTVQVRMRHREGRWIDVEVSAALYRDGESMGVLAEVRDLTEELRLREALVQSQKLEAVGTFVGGVAHDFNNLLTTIGGSIELARDTDDTRQWLERATVSTERAARLVQELLQFSRSDSTVHEPVDLGELVDRSIEAVREAIDARIEITRADASGPLLVRGDWEQLQQVLENVIVNAGEALDGRLTGGDPSAERARITVRLSTTSDGLRELRVADNGAGIAPEIQHRIFDPFFTTKVVGRATGLGLSTAYGIVADHGGQMSVQSTAGEGTEITICLPAFRGEAHTDGDLKTTSA